MTRLFFFFTYLFSLTILKGQSVEYFLDKMKFYRDREQVDSLFYYVNRGIKTAKENENFEGLGKIYIVLGNHYYKLNEGSSLAYKNYHKAYRAYSRVSDSARAGVTLLRISILEKNIHDFSKAKETSFKALAYLKNTDKKREISSIYNNLGILFNETGNLEKSIRFHQKSLAVRDSLAMSKLIIQSLNNIATAYRDHDQFKKAEQYYKKGLSFPNTVLLKFPKEYARLIDNEAYSQFSQQKAGVLSAFKKALLLRISNNDDAGVIVSYLHLSEYYLNP